MTPDPTPQLDGFEIVEPLTLSETVSSYVAKQLSMDRLVTLFVLSKHLSQDAAASKEFQAKLKAVVRAEPSCYAAIINAGSQGPCHYVVAEHMPGKTLAQVVEQECPMQESEAFAIVRDVARALADCAKSNIVHGELKASDVVVNEERGLRIGRVGLLGWARSQSDLQVYQRRDMHSLGKILDKLISGDEGSEFGFADEASPAAASDDKPEGVDALVARLKGAGGEPFADYGELIADLDRRIEGVPSSPTSPPLISFDEPSLHPAAKPASPLGQDDEAIVTTLRLDDSDGRSKVEKVYAKAFAAIEAHQYKSAAAMLRRLPQGYRDVAVLVKEAQAKLKAWYDNIEAGKAMWEKGEAKEAIDHWAAALEIRPNNKGLKQKIAQAKSMAGQEIMIIDYLKEAKRHSDQGDFPAARLACQQAIKINSKHQTALNLLSEIDLLQMQSEVADCRDEANNLYSQKQYGPAIAMWQKALSISLGDAKLKAELDPLIAAARRRQRRFRVMIAFGVLTFVALLAAAVYLTLFR